MEPKNPRSEEQKQSNNIILFPFMAQGHIIPILALALKLHHRLPTTTISIVNTPLNISKLKSSFPTSFPIQFLPLPFNPSDHNLPPNAENTDVLPYALVIRLITAAVSLKPAFSSLISTLSPSCIISDIFLGWTVDVAKEFGIYHAMFCGGGGFGFGCYYSVWVHMPHRKSDSPEFVLPDFPEAGKLHVSQFPANQLHADGEDPWSIFQAENLPKWVESDALLFNTVEEMDPIGLEYFRRCTRKNVWAIGPVFLPTENRKTVGKASGIESELLRKWLDSKPISSVLYVSFGSHNTISAADMMELAMALETCGASFVWVVRPPLGFDINSEFREDEWLPTGFVRRMRDEGRGVVVHNWAPQVEILSHEAVKAFVSHCGWGSVMEALGEGVVLLGWPMAGEQFYNAKFLEEKVGVCVEVARGSRKVAVRHEDLATKIRSVMIGEKGQEMQRRAREVRKMITDAAAADGSSTKALDEFLEATGLLTLKT